MSLYRYDEHRPCIDASAYVAESATVIGQVSLGRAASVWPQAVLRADNESIRVGEGSNVQDGAVLHSDPGFPVELGPHVTVGHQAMLHGCTIGEGSLIGIRAVVLNGAVIGRNCLVAAGALVTEGRIFPDNCLILGVPAKVARQLSEEEMRRLRENALDYVERARCYRSRLERLD